MLEVITELPVILEDIGMDAGRWHDLSSAAAPPCCAYSEAAHRTLGGVMADILDARPASPSTASIDLKISVRKQTPQDLPIVLLILDH